MGSPPRSGDPFARRGAGGEGTDDDYFPIWPDNAATLEIFLACRTQWRMLAGATSLVRLGLDYAGVEVVLRLHRVKNQQAAQIFNELQHMEFAAMAEWSA